MPKIQLNNITPETKILWHRITRKISPILLLCLLVTSLLACGSIPSFGSSSTTNPTLTDTPSDQNTPALDVWQKSATGIEVRYENWKLNDNQDIVTIVRLDLSHVHLRIGYQPDQPLQMSDWLKQECKSDTCNKPLVIINGGYFDQQNRATGLVVASGQTFGTSYDGFGGMLSVDAQGKVRLRSLHQQPYNASNERLQQATQSSPMLLLPGGQRSQFNANAVPARRSIVAMDRQGRLLLIASPGNVFSLYDMQELLVSSDLSIDVALNLDGGASTGLYLSGGSSSVTIDSFARLPIVIIAQAN